MLVGVGLSHPKNEEIWEIEVGNHGGCRRNGRTAGHVVSWDGEEVFVTLCVTPKLGEGQAHPA